MPRVSIILTTFQRPAMLLEAINGALSQTYEDFELLVMDNASTDYTGDVVRQLKDPRLLYIRRPVNNGSAANWMEGLSRARGELILNTHDDDIMHPTMLEREVEVMDASGAKMVGCNVRIVDKNGGLMQDRFSPDATDRIFTRGEFIRAYMTERFTFKCSTQLTRRCDHDWMSGSGDPGIGPLGDIYMVCLANSKGSVVHIADPLLDYRVHESGETFTLDITPSDIKLHMKVRDLCRSSGLDWCLPYIHSSMLRYRILQSLIHGVKPRSLLRKLGGIETEFPNNFSLPVFPDGRARKYQGKRVAIVGSLLNAFLLAEECLASGVKVAYFVDNNTKRQGKRLDDLNIYPFNRLQTDPVDLVISSCEKRSIDQVRPMVSKYTDTHVVSWRDL
jgi:glycosyltransferase involved in cell wall biosynthesis